MDLPISLIWSQLLVLLALFTVASFFLGRLRRRGHVDLIWALAIGVQASVYASLSGGWGPRRLLFAGLAVLWACRLAMHLYRRLDRDGEDGRYLAMERAAGSKVGIFFLGFFLLQAVAAWVFAIPFAALVQDANPSFRIWEVLAAAFWLFALAGNGLADRQLDRWRSRTENRGRTCREGLWAWSRHPNYFFEWLLWCSYPLAAIGTPSLPLQIGVAALMYVMVTRVSGIPFTEQQALRSRGDDYRAYQETTSPFFPRPPRHVPDHPSC